jgi:hypothetical protein
LIVIVGGLWVAVIALGGFSLATVSSTQAAPDSTTV